MNYFYGLSDARSGYQPASSSPASNPLGGYQGLPLSGIPTITSNAVERARPFALDLLDTDEIMTRRAEQALLQAGLNPMAFKPQARQLSSLQRVPLHQRSYQEPVFYRMEPVPYRREQRELVPFKQRPLVKHTVYFPFIPMPDSLEHKTVPIKVNSLYCFHGFSSVLTLQHRDSFQIDGARFISVDHYYQMCKVRDLVGVDSERFHDGSRKNYGAVAKELLREAKVNRGKVDEWRVSSGVVVIQKALLEKVRQSAILRGALIQTGEKIIAHTYAQDDWFGVGVPFNYLKSWCSGMEKSKASIKIPMEFPLTPETVKHVPTFGKGRNVLGVIYMILREKVERGQLDSLSVDGEGQEEVNDVTQQMGDNFDLGGQGPTTDNPPSSSSDSKAVANGASSMEVDFSADDLDVGLQKPASQSVTTSTAKLPTNGPKTNSVSTAAKKVKVPIPRTAVKKVLVRKLVTKRKGP